MKSAKQVVEPLITLSADQLVDWLLKCAKGEACSPVVESPSDYDSTTDYLLDCVRDLNDERIALIFGDAACKALRQAFDDGVCSNSETRQETGSMMIDLLFLIESLPCKPESADQLSKFLLLLLANGACKFLSNGENDLRARMLLALASKVTGTRTVKPELAAWLQDDFSNPDFVIPAYSVAIRLNPSYASEHLQTAIECLQRHKLPTKYFQFEVAKVLVINQREREKILGAQSRIKDQLVVNEFRNSLVRLHALALVEAFDQLVQSNLVLERIPQPGATATTAYSGSMPIIPEQPLNFETYLIGCLRAFGNNPNQIGNDLGKLLAAVHPALKREAESSTTLTDRQGVILRPLLNLVTNSDNGLWKGKNSLSDGTRIPNGFDKSSRRLMAAYAVNTWAHEVAVRAKGEKQGLDDAKAFNQAVGRSKIPSTIDHVATRLPRSLNKILRMSVSPFPEDRLIYLTLKTACQHSTALSIKGIPKQWGEPSVIRSDVSLINQWVDIPQVKDSKPSQDIFRHGGYYVFASTPPPEQTRERFVLAFDLGIERYRLGEYPYIMAELRKKYKIDEIPAKSRADLPDAPDWSTDFESFVMGNSIYTGGSINARLLKRIWQHTNRIWTICEPNDFKYALGTIPADRLVLGSNLISSVQKSKTGELQEALVSLYRAAALFLHEAAENARQNLSGWGRSVIRHFLVELSPPPSDKPRGIRWNFVVTEDDMISLILNDNDFSLGHGGSP